MSAPTPSGPSRPPNHLLGETSPYLLQHLHNPVDWHPWGPAALEKARREDKPIFLSIGYAACHWCHVMERECFESDAIAGLLNDGFVPIKVDREERPDLDDIYMTAVQMMTGQGGWPLNVFLTPDLKPFYGGTYFPPEDRWGRPGFPTLLAKIREIWAARREDVIRSADEMTEHLRAAAQPPAEGPGAPVGRRESARASGEFAARFDERWGGFGGAPKFPPHGALHLLLREHARGGETMPMRMVETTLERMSSGGMFDHVGGGFCRYSVDERWLVPHFEKMLYDQALLVPVYVDAWLAIRKPAFRRAAEETLDFVRRELTSPEGGCFSSLDADSEGHEGSYYVFDPEEIRAALGETDGAFFCETYGISPEGNFEGKSIPNLLGGTLAERARAAGTTEEALVARLAPLRRTVLAARSHRVRPGTDDKVLTAWNGLMITAFARSYQAFGREEDLVSARRAASFVLGSLRRDGRLLVSYREGKAHLNAYLDDYAFLARGLVDLYESDFDRKHLDDAAALAGTMIARFGDPRGGFFFTSDDHETLLTRSRSLHDGALPSGTGVACEALARLAIHLDEAAFRRHASNTLAAYRDAVSRAPSAFASWLVAAETLDGPALEIAVIGPADDPRTCALLAAARGAYLPVRAFAFAAPGAETTGLPILERKALREGRPTAFVCRNRACEAPVTDPDVLRDQLRSRRLDSRK